MKWQPGETGNPDGAKRQRRFLAALERALLADDGRRLRDAADKLLDLAAAGEPWAIMALADRLDGKPSQQIMADVEGGSVTFAVIAYHNPAQVHPAPLPVADTAGARLGEETSGGSLASPSG